jgi:hypothetical protein
MRTSTDSSSDKKGNNMATYTITLSSAEDKALSYAALSQDEWIQNAVKERCRMAIDEIIQVVVAKCLETQQPIPNSTDLMVELAFTNNWVKTAVQRNADFEAELAARAAQNG